MRSSPGGTPCGGRGAGAPRRRGGHRRRPGLLVRRLRRCCSRRLPRLSHPRRRLSPPGVPRRQLQAMPAVHLRAAVSTGASGKIGTRHASDTWKCGSLTFIFTHPPEDKKLIFHWLWRAVSGHEGELPIQFLRLMTLSSLPPAFIARPVFSTDACGSRSISTSIFFAASPTH